MKISQWIFILATKVPDCIKVRGDVCGCNGRETADAINKKILNRREDKLKAELAKRSNNVVCK